MRTKTYISSFVTLIIVIALLVGCARPTVEVPQALMQQLETEETTEASTEPQIGPSTEEPSTEPPTEETQTPELVPEIPLYNQLDYNCPFGYVFLEYKNLKATVKNSGCGVTSLAMVASYLLDDPEITPDILAERFGSYNTKWGASWTMFTETDDILGIGDVVQVMNWDDGVEEALRNGQPVISNQVAGSIFTSSGHYIVLTGMTEDGRVMVNDPNGENWPRLADGFENGFKKESITWHCTAYWIYPSKEEVQSRG